MLPPPTENTNRPSFSLKREEISQLLYAVSQPSSLVRAVNSETLSVMQYDSKLHSFLKSHVACDAWPAPPPEPAKNSLPPWFLTLTRTLTTFSMSFTSIFESTDVVSLKKVSEKVLMGHTLHHD